jgi:hypothetical protein
LDSFLTQKIRKMKNIKLTSTLIASWMESNWLTVIGSLVFESVICEVKGQELPSELAKALNRNMLIC